MIGILKIITSIPWYVWILLAYVILTGIKALQPQVVSIKKIFILPLIFIFIALNGLVKQNASDLYVTIWFVFFAASAYFIWHCMKPLMVTCDRKKGLILLSGNKITLILLLAIFASRFTFGFLSATHPELKSFFFFNLISLLVSGTVSGICFGRLCSLLMKFLKSPHADLVKPE